MKETNWNKVEALYSEIIKEIASDPEREGLVDTPRRVVKYWKELLQGEKKTNQEIAEENDVSFTVTNDDLVIEKDIEIFSTCEHHLALIYDAKVTIAYIPSKGEDGTAKVIGLSKLARIANDCARRLTLQEKIGHDIMECLKIILGTEDIAVRIQAKHGCMTARGIKNSTAYTVTKATSGAFRTDSRLLQELE